MNNTGIARLLFTISTVLLCLTSSAADQERAANYYAQWAQGPNSDAGYFPIAVWLQDPKNASRYKAAGINLYVGLWKGPTEEQLTALEKAGMRVICSQNDVGLAHRDDPVIAGWMHGDEPDNAQPVTDPKTGKKTYGPPIPPREITQDYQGIRRADPSRPILLNLGQGVANDEWVGRGPGARLDDYLDYVKGCDVVSFDVYPVAGIRKPDGENYLWYVAKGVGRLKQWTGGQKTIWNCIECTHISNEKAKATPHQVKAEVWMSIIHGSMGLIYFVHEFKPRFREAALLDDPEMLDAVTRINRQIHELAPILNTPTIEDAVRVRSSSEDTPIDILVKRHRGYLYVFAVAMRNAATTGRFDVNGLKAGAEAIVIGENRTIDVAGGEFADTFDAYDVHLYRIRD